MRRLKLVVVGVFCLASASVAATSMVGAPPAAPGRGWWQARGKMAVPTRMHAARAVAATGLAPGQVPAEAQKLSEFLEGQRLFELETFGGNGRTCLTCHSRETGTVSPADARRRFLADSNDPLFVHDGSDDDNGDGFGDGAHVTRMHGNATVLMRIRLHDDVSVEGHPEIEEVTVPRGIPTTLNTPGLDPVLMLDGRQPTLQEQARGAITQHAQATRAVTTRELDLIARFQQNHAFFTSPVLSALAFTGGHAPELPRGRTASEQRGRVFFEDLPPDFSVAPPNFKPGACAACHSGPMLNQTNQFLPVAVPPGTRFQSVLVSEFNVAGNPVMTFVFQESAARPGPGYQSGWPAGRDHQGKEPRSRPCPGQRPGR